MVEVEIQKRMQEVVEVEIQKKRMQEVVEVEIGRASCRERV